MKLTVHIIILISSFSCRTDVQRGELESASLPNAKTPTIVQIELVKKQPFKYFIEGSGQLRAPQQIEVFFKTSGLVANVLVYNSQRVNAGTVLARLDNQEAKLALQQAEAELKERQVEYKSQIIGFESAQLDSNYITILENVRYGSGLARAELKVEEAKVQLQRTRTAAPISGIVANLSVEKYQSVAMDQTLCTIYAPGSLILAMQVLEGDVGQLRVSQPAEVHPVALPGQAFAAEVIEINPMVDENSMVQVKLKLLKTEGLLPGMRATATIRVPTDSSLVVPKEAVVIRSGKAVVFTEEDGLAKWNYVTTGLDNGKSVQIIDGLTPNRYVIIDNNLQLAHDAPIQVIQATPSN